MRKLSTGRRSPPPLLPALPAEQVAPAQRRFLPQADGAQGTRGARLAAAAVPPAFPHTPQRCLPSPAGCGDSGPGSCPAATHPAPKRGAGQRRPLFPTLRHPRRHLRAGPRRGNEPTWRRRAGTGGSPRPPSSRGCSAPGALGGTGPGPGGEVPPASWALLTQEQAPRSAQDHSLPRDTPTHPPTHRPAVAERSHTCGQRRRR